jgi:hypothetical protein
MDTDTGLRIRLLRVVVLLLFAVTCYQLGYSAGHFSGDWEKLRREITAKPIGAPYDDEFEPPPAATAVNDTADIESAG